MKENKRKEFLELQEKLDRCEINKDVDLLDLLIPYTYNRTYLYDDQNKYTGAYASCGNICKIISTESYVAIFEEKNIGIVRMFDAKKYPFLVNYFKDYFKSDANLNNFKANLLLELKEQYKLEKNKIGDIGKLSTMQELQTVIDMIDKLASKINYDAYMKEYITITNKYEEQFDEFFNDLVLDEVL